MKTKKVEKLAPAALQKLAGLYLGYDMAIEAAKRKQKEVREQLLEQVEQHGVAAPKADKTQRIETENFTIDVTNSESLVVDDVAVEKFADRLPLARFKKLFTLKTYFVKARDAEKAIEQEPAAIRTAFTKCFRVKPVSPKLSVKEKEK